MIEFKAVLGPDSGLHFVCTKLEGDAVAHQWAVMDERARELTGMGLGNPVYVVGKDNDPNPMVILALVLDGVLKWNLEQDSVALFVRDETWPAGRRPVGERLKHMTVAVWFPDSDSPIEGEGGDRREAPSDGC